MQAGENFLGALGIPVQRRRLWNVLLPPVCLGLPRPVGGIDVAGPGLQRDDIGLAADQVVGALQHVPGEVAVDPGIDTLRTLACFEKLAGHPVTVFTDHLQDTRLLAGRLAALRRWC